MMRNPILLAALMSIFIAACNDDDSTAPAMASEEAAEIVAASLAEDTQGLSVQVEDASQEAEGLVEEANSGGRIAETTSCGFDTTATFTRTNPAGTLITYDYAFTYTYGLDCDQNNMPESMNFAFTQSGEVDAPRFSSVDSRNGDWLLNGLELSTTEYVVNGSYEREGVQTSKVRNQNAYTFELSQNLSNLRINKGTYQIEGGTSSFTMTGSATTGGNFNFSGTITFLGNGSAQITISGDSYIASLDDGEIDEAG